MAGQGRGFRRAAAGLAGLLVAAGAVTGPASAQDAPAPTPVELPLAQGLDPARWCRPVVSAAVDPAPLHCWLALTAADPTPATVAGINFGDLPAWGTVDVAAIGAELDRYQAEAEAAAAASKPARGNAASTSKPQPEASSSESIGTTIGTTKDELLHQCFTLEIVAACDAYWDYAVGNPPEDTGPSPAPAPEDDMTDHYVDFDVDGATDWWQEMGERAQQAIVEQCDGRGGSSTWDMDGNITVDCN